MKTIRTIEREQSLYAAGWQHVKPGIVVALMFVIAASAAMFREQNAAGAVLRGGSIVGHGRNYFAADKKHSIAHPVTMSLPIENLRDAEGRLTSKGESFFLLLARRAKSMSLSIMLTTTSLDDAEFATSIAARMIGGVSLSSMQLSVSVEGGAVRVDAPNRSLLTITITRYETVDRGAE